MRFARDDLIRKALLALEEAANATTTAPVPRSRALRFTLAFLFAVTDGKNRNWFDAFWQSVTRDDDTAESAALGRGASATAALNAIYRLVGIERTTEMMFGETSRRRAQGDAIREGKHWTGTGKPRR